MTVGASGVKIKILHLTLMSKWGGKMGGEEIIITQELCVPSTSCSPGELVTQ